MNALAAHGEKIPKSTFKVTRNARLKIHDAKVTLRKAYSLESEKRLCSRDSIRTPLVGVVIGYSFY